MGRWCFRVCGHSGKIEEFVCFLLIVVGYLYLDVYVLYINIRVLYIIVCCLTYKYMFYNVYRYVIEHIFIYIQTYIGMLFDV